ncbi:MAG: chorismate mutase [Acidimicrobiales bacterium]
MAAMLRALRGATTVDEDSESQLIERIQALIAEMLRRNSLGHEDLVSILFTATEDVTSMFPAAAARRSGLGDIPLICARELSVRGATPLCIRVMMHVYTEASRSELHHVYLEGASSLRDDLPA